MTKNVRIENADTSDYKVEIQVWEKAAPNAEGVTGPDVYVETLALDYPTQLVSTYITSTRYLVVKEKQ